jgi:uncharacterized protein YggU (UPF0235/DUF167 family)
VILHVRLTPRANADRIDGWTTDPDGRSVLAVRVARGGQSRLKAIEVDGMDAAEAERVLRKL